MAARILSEIWIYPIKSLGGIRMSRVKVMPKGLQHDRRWMLIDETGNFITQRVYSKMAFFKLSFSGQHFSISFGSEVIDLPVDAPVSTTPISATIWDDVVSVFEALGPFSQWFSQRLGISCRLVFFPESQVRLVDENYRVEDDQVSLADGYPFLIIGQRSLEDLNTRLKIPVPMNRFRPNFVFTGGEPFEEDTWHTFSIGKSKFIGVKPCSRCTLITVDQETGEKGIEPLATLATYRKVDNKINFGQNILAIDYNEIYEGDKIELDE